MKEPTIPDITNKFKRVREVREMLRQKAEKVLDLFILNAEAAHEAGEYEVAGKSLQWLLEHMPSDADTGEKLVDTSVDKQVKESGKKGGGIQIFLAPTAPMEKRLPEAVIEAEAEVIDE
jgi:hypothetical protein